MTLDEAKEYVIKVLGEEKAKLWWKTKNPHLGGMSPDYMLQVGREKKLLQWIEASKEGYMP